MKLELEVEAAADPCAGMLVASFAHCTLHFARFSLLLVGARDEGRPSIGVAGIAVPKGKAADRLIGQ